jgi:hypothetical protein
MATKKKAAKLTAGSDEPEEKPKEAAPGRLVLTSEPPSMLDGKAHAGLAIGLETSGKPSALVLPDISGMISGTQPIYLAKPLKLELENIVAYLKAKSPEAAGAIEKNEMLKSFLKNTAVEVKSFYVRLGQEGKAADPANKVEAVKAVSRLLLMEFNVNFAAGKQAADAKMDDPAFKTAGGLIGSLTGDAALAKLFDVTSLSIRVLQCDEDSLATLQNYINLLSED